MKKLLNNWNICTKLGGSICGCWPSKMERSITQFVTMRKMRGPLQKFRLNKFDEHPFGLMLVILLSPMIEMILVQI